MDARRFACEAADYGFGLKSKDGFADQLVRLADEIRNGDLLPQRITVSETASKDAYCLQEIRIVVAPRLRELIGDGGFTVAVVDRAV